MTMTLAEYEARHGALTPAEKILSVWCWTGLDVIIGWDVPPPDAPPKRQIRASFLRHLALGEFKDCKPGPKGVRVIGVLIVGDGPEQAETRGLDLEGCSLEGELGLFFCRFTDTMLLRGTTLPMLKLSGSHLEGALKTDSDGEPREALSADGLKATRGVFIRNATANGAVRFVGARLGGDLDCTDATFEGVSDGVAFSADGLEAEGSAFLRGATAKGAVRLVGAKLGGDLSCTGAGFEAIAGGFALAVDRLEAKGGGYLSDVSTKGAVRLVGAKLGGNLSCNGARFEAAGERGLLLDGARVEGAFFWRGVAGIEGSLDLTGARFGVLIDDTDSWPGAGDLLLNRCRYGAILGGPVDAASRLEWLALQRPERVGQDFWPQPYEHLAKVFREMGHRGDARRVLIRKEELQRQAARRRSPWYSSCWSVFWDRILGWTIRYGYEPWWALVPLAVAWLLGILVYLGAYDAGAFKPNSAFVLRAPEWVLCTDKPGTLSTLQFEEHRKRVQGESYEHQLACFEAQPEAASFPEFNAWWYSADVLIPLVSLELQEYWLPDEDHPSIWAWARVVHWVQIVLGWALSLLAVAGFSGLIKSD